MSCHEPRARLALAKHSASQGASIAEISGYLRLEDPNASRRCPLCLDRHRVSLAPTSSLLFARLPCPIYIPAVWIETRVYPRQVDMSSRLSQMARTYL